jgi:hypothetical protein
LQKLNPASRLLPSGSMHRLRLDRDAAENLDAIRLVASSPTRTLEASMNQQAVVCKFSHVKPGDMEHLKIISPADFRTVDVPPAVDKVPPPTPWK